MACLSTKDTSYSKDKACWRCSNRQCNSKVSIRSGTWFESSHLSMSQVLELTYFWVYECTEKLVMRECDIATWSTVVDCFPQLTRLMLIRATIVLKPSNFLRLGPTSSVQKSYSNYYKERIFSLLPTDDGRPSLIKSLRQSTIVATI